MMVVQNFYGPVGQVAGNRISNEETPDDVRRAVRRERIAELLQQARPSRRTRRQYRRKLTSRMRLHTARRDAARRRKIWNVWNAAKVPLLLAAMAYSYAFLVLDDVTPFPGWRGLGLALLSVATCVILFFRDRLQRACDEELRRHEAALTKIHETLAVM